MATRASSSSATARATQPRWSISSSSTSIPRLLARKRLKLELQHVSIPIPADGRDRARAFYGGLLGLEEREVPPTLDPAQLIWFRVGGDLELHLFESDESAPRSQHFCLRLASGLDELRKTLEDGGVETQDTDEIVGRPRFFCLDPFGNRVELTQWLEPS